MQVLFAQAVKLLYSCTKNHKNSLNLRLENLKILQQKVGTWDGIQINLEELVLELVCLVDKKYYSSQCRNTNSQYKKSTVWEPFPLKHRNVTQLISFWSLPEHFYSMVGIIVNTDHFYLDIFGYNRHSNHS